MPLRARPRARAPYPLFDHARVRAQDYAPYVATVEHEMDSDVGQIIKCLLTVAGFTKDGNTYKPGTPASITAMFGSETTRGMFNPLLRIFYFTPRSIRNHKLARSATSTMSDPTGASERAVYDAAAAELGGSERDSAGKLLPAYMLRKLIADKWISSLDVPDWRVRAIARVESARPFVASFKTKIKKVEGADCCACTTMSIEFVWQGRFRAEPGGTHMRDIFKTLT